MRPISEWPNSPPIVSRLTLKSDKCRAVSISGFCRGDIRDRSRSKRTVYKSGNEWAPKLRRTIITSRYAVLRPFLFSDVNNARRGA